MKQKYEVIDVKDHPSGIGFVVEWKSIPNPFEVLKRTHVLEEDENKVVEEIEKLANAIVTKNKPEKIERIKNIFKEKKVLKT